MPACRRAHRASPAGFLEQLEQTPGNGRGVHGIHQVAGLVVADDVGDAPDARGHGRTAGRAGLDQRQRRPLEPGRERHDVQGSIERRKVVDPAKEHRPRPDEIHRASLESLTQLPIARDGEGDILAFGRHDPCSSQEGLVVLDRHESPDAADDRPGGRQPQASSCDRPIDRVHRLGVDPDRDHVPTLRDADAELEEIVPYLLGDGDQRIGASGEPPLQRGERRVPHSSEVPLEHVTVEGVHDGGPSTGRGEPAEGSGLGHVRVHERRPESPDEVRDPSVREDVVHGIDLTHQGRYGHDPPPPCQLTLRRRHGTVDQGRLEAPLRQGVLQRKHGSPGATDVQAGHHLHDADAVARGR